MYTHITCIIYITFTYIISHYNALEQIGIDSIHTLMHVCLHTCMHAKYACIYNTFPDTNLHHLHTFVYTNMHNYLNYITSEPHASYIHSYTHTHTLHYIRTHVIECNSNA